MNSLRLSSLESHGAPLSFSRFSAPTSNITISTATAVGPDARGPANARRSAKGTRGVNEVLKNIDLSPNNLGDEGEKAIHDAVSGREGFELVM